MRNMLIREILGIIVERLKKRLPPSWTVEVLKSSAPNVNALIEIRASGRKECLRLAAAIKQVINPKDVSWFVRKIRQANIGSPFLIAPFLSPRTRDLLGLESANYADLTGNLHLALDKPLVFIETAGAAKSPFAVKRPLASLKGPISGRVIRALCDFKPPFGVRELAARAQTSAASVSRVTDFLEKEAVVIKEKSGQVTQVAWPDLLRRWGQDYSFLAANAVGAYLEPRGLPFLIERLINYAGRYCITGSFAAARCIQSPEPRVLWVYAEDPGDLIQSMDLRSAETGANVLVAEPFDPVVFDRLWYWRALTYSAISQVAVDLLTGPDDSHLEAETLLGWMQEHEESWRPRERD